MTRRSMAAVADATERLQNVIEDWKEEEDSMLRDIEKEQGKINSMYEKLNRIGDDYANRLDKEVPGWREILSATREVSTVNNNTESYEESQK